MSFEMPTDNICFSSLTQYPCPSSAQCVFVLLCSSPGFSRPEIFTLLNHVIVGIFEIRASLGLIEFPSLVFIVQEQRG